MPGLKNHPSGKLANSLQFAIPKLAWIVLAFSLAITAAATLYMKSSVDRIDEHARILLSGAALFNASEEVTREQWRIFTQYQKIEKQLPGGE
jgi:CHASE1-domain containing sensor protein